MNELTTYKYNGLFIPTYIRKKSSLLSEFWGLVFDKLFPNQYSTPDIRTLLNKNDLETLYLAINKIENSNISEIKTFLEVIRNEATIAFNELASIINGEQQNLYIHDRLVRLNINTIFLSGVIDQMDQIRKIESQLDELKQILKTIRKSYKKNGTNIHLTYRVEKLSSDLSQASDIIKLCKKETPIAVVCTIIKKLIKHNILNKGMIHFVSSKTKILTKTIVEHNSAHGEKYIATNLKEYLKIFKSSLIGGLMIALFALLKIKIESWDFPLLGEGLLFGINYAFCFILVDILGGIIATKQPAMTANTLLAKIDISDNNNDVSKKIVTIFADVSKSQFISLLGNLSIAFILSILISLLYSIMYHHPLLDLDKGNYLLNKNNIAYSGAVFYASIAGIFLSFAGFIAGYMDNAVLFYKLNERFIDKYKGKPKLAKFYNYILKKFGKFSGSFSLGMLLGMAGAIGMFSGIPFDIRHVAFSSAHIAYGSLAVNLEWFSKIGFLLLVSIATIGLVNFLVSFILTLLIALNSKKINNKEIFKGILLTLRTFIFKPWLFILPINFNGTKHH